MGNIQPPLTWRDHPVWAAVVVLACLTPVSAPVSHAAVSHCRDEAGRTHFQQFACPPGTTRVDRQTDNPLSVVRTAPLSEAETQALARIERSLAEDRQTRSRERARASRARSAERAEALKSCQEAKRHLAELAETRRKGYRANAEARLESEEARWRAARKASC